MNGPYSIRELNKGGFVLMHNDNTLEGLEAQAHALNLLTEIRDLTKKTLAIEEGCAARMTESALASECKRAALLRRIAEIETGVAESEAAHAAGDAIQKARQKHFQKEASAVLARLRTELAALDKPTEDK